MTRADLNNDRGYLLGYAHLMMAQARRTSTARVKSIWLTAAHNARIRAGSLTTAPPQGDLFS